jgi:hypothetical protein
MFVGMGVQNQARHVPHPLYFWKKSILKNVLLAIFMELSPSSEATNCTVITGLSNILWNPKVRYRVHKTCHQSLS